MAVEVKRFWTTVELAEVEGGYAILLDARPVKTPARERLILPTEALAEASATEWRDCGEEIEPRAMPLTGLANAAIDRVAPDPEAYAAELARYAEADQFCYRADGPASLVERQAESWDPLLAWARRRFDVDFAIGTGIVHIAQPEATVKRLAAALSALDPFRLAAMSPLITIGGSLIAALALVEGAYPAEALWEAVSLDERWQLKKWGSDAEAEAALALRRADYMAAARFVALLD